MRSRSVVTVDETTERSRPTSSWRMRTRRPLRPVVGAGQAGVSPSSWARRSSKGKRGTPGISSSSTARTCSRQGKNGKAAIGARAAVLSAWANAVMNTVLPERCSPVTAMRCRRCDSGEASSAAPTLSSAASATVFKRESGVTKSCPSRFGQPGRRCGNPPCQKKGGAGGAVRDLSLSPRSQEQGSLTAFGMTPVSSSTLRAYSNTSTHDARPSNIVIPNAVRDPSLSRVPKSKGLSLRSAGTPAWGGNLSFGGGERESVRFATAACNRRPKSAYSGRRKTDI